MDTRHWLFDPGRDGGPRDIGLLILRVGLAVAMMTHGWGKLQGFAERSEQFPDPLGLGSPVSMALAIFAELVCAVAVAIGLLTRWSVLPIVFTMMVAFFVIHGDDSFREKELALTYLVGFVAVLLAGPGRLSVDGLLRRR